MPEARERSDAGGIAEGLQRQAERLRAIRCVRAQAQESGWGAKCARAACLQKANVANSSLLKRERSTQILCRVEHQKALKTALHAAPAFV